VRQLPHGHPRRSATSTRTMRGTARVSPEPAMRPWVADVPVVCFGHDAGPGLTRSERLGAGRSRRG
jgi:hypothetical protein